MLYESWTAQNPEAAAALTIDGEDEWMNTMDIQLGTPSNRQQPGLPSTTTLSDGEDAGSVLG